MTALFIHLNLDWNAEPNDPAEVVLVEGDSLTLSFNLNPWAYEAVEGERAVLAFSNCTKWRLGATNDEGWYRGQCRYSEAAPAWGEFYEIVGDDPLRNTPADWREISTSKVDQRHFLFYFRDQTFECAATDWQLVRPARKPA